MDPGEIREAGYRDFTSIVVGCGRFDTQNCKNGHRMDVSNGYDSSEMIGSTVSMNL